MSTLCIDLGGTEIKLGVLDGAAVLASGALPNTGSAADLGAVRDTATGLGIPFDAVAIAVPGVVDRASASLVAAHGKYGWARGMDLDAWSQTAFSLPAVVENDARAALLGEVVHGCAAGARDAVLVTLGTGIGTAAMIDGELLRGRHDHAGILGGHITVELDGPPCTCGNIGCAEAVASTWALQRDAAADAVLGDALRRADGDAPGLRELVERRDDPAVGAEFERFVGAWAATIVGMCHAYDPDVVVVSGGAMRAADVLLPRLEALVHAHLWSSSHRPPIVTPPEPEHSVLLGLSAASRRPRKDPS
ncbi:ROK family protein [Leifsonia sp. NPDC080035]|uniref:ROK family protein n=1 Tax=Leifsonia sp. NPDC080035 TaxID=3143936 RepID=A0AAU7G713_9MICO